MEYQQKLANRIRKIRELANIKQTYMADKLGISQQQYSALEKGDVKITTEKLQKIANLLNVTPEKITEFDEQKLFGNIESSSFYDSSVANINHINENHSREIKEIYENRIIEIHKMYREQITELHTIYKEIIEKIQKK
ncbi:MAG: XRE family transcriptional regulator [Bacteroidetes bacterium]|nr:MAG: XRE family transcriptional regulator [Bacteroidota bacterium]TAG89937.1 MAG: XRE family transcriptional regulator [Bacteroidota bacterium]